MTDSYLRAQLKLKAFILIYCDYFSCQSCPLYINAAFYIFTLKEYMICSATQCSRYIISSFLLIQPHPHEHKNPLTPDECHSSLHTRCRVGISYRMHTDWAPGPNSPPHIAGDKHAPVALKMHRNNENRS